MAPRSWQRTVDIVCRDFPADTVPSDVAKWVLDFFVNSYPNFKVVSIQFVPGRVARVTFDKHCTAAKGTIEDLREIPVNGVQCAVLQPAPSAPRLQNVLVYQYPHEFSGESVAAALGKFGTVTDVSFQRWTNLPDVGTGTRVVRMTLNEDVPRFLFIRGIRCKIWYRDQPLTCDICSKGGHKASACPDKGKCLRCHCPGHVARHCPNNAGRLARLADEAVARAAGVSVPPDEVPPVVVSPNVVMPAGDLSQGLQHAADLDAGFPPFPALSDSAAADAASVAEVALRSLGSELNSVVGSSAPSSASLLDDERYNQLDEIASQNSISILANCRSDGAPSDGELVKRNQIPGNNLSDNGVVNLSNNSVDLSNDNGSVNLSKENDSIDLSNDSNVNYYGSVVASDGASSGPPIVDSVMSQASDQCKRPISESSSDETPIGPDAPSKNPSKKAKSVVGSKSSDASKKCVSSDAGSKKNVVGSRKGASGEGASKKTVIPSSSVVPAKKGGGITKKVGAIVSATLPKGSRFPADVSSAARLALGRFTKK